MNPITHFALSWLISDSTCNNKRDRILVTVSGIIPDLDGLIVIADMARGDSTYPLYNKYHHILSHNLSFCIFTGLIVYFLSQMSLRTMFLSMMVFHLHLFCDVIGARGPDGYQWPIPYLNPFSSAMHLKVGWQWGLTSWQNFLISIILITYIFYRTKKYGRSPMEFFGENINRAFINTVSSWGTPKQ
ncbi:metal-dependent hydrolase [bacterium]|nr:metal-dependent hydrolase [bacterium]